MCFSTNSLEGNLFHGFTVRSIPNYKEARELVQFIQRHLEHKKFENPGQQKRFAELMGDRGLGQEVDIIFTKAQVFEMMQNPTFGGHDGKIQSNMLMRFILMFMLAFKKLDNGELYRFNAFLEDMRDCAHPVRERPIYRLDDNAAPSCLVLNRNINADSRWMKLDVDQIYGTWVNQMLNDTYPIYVDFPIHCFFGKYTTEFILSVYNIEEEKVPLITRCKQLKASLFKGHFPNDDGIYLYSELFKDF